MRNYEELKNLVPKSKHDISTIAILENLEYDELYLLAWDLLRWSADSNWPVAQYLCNILIKLNKRIVPLLEKIIGNGDDEWVWHLMNPLINKLTLDAQSSLIPAFLEYIRCDHGIDYDEIVEGFLSDYVAKRFDSEPETLMTESKNSFLTNEHILAEISYLPTDQGGKTRPVKTGYSPQFYYNNQDWVAHHNYFEVEFVNPGQTVKAKITFLNPEMHLGKILTGSHFLIREGQKIFGYGHVVKILNLEPSAIQSAIYHLKNDKTYRKIIF